MQGRFEGISICRLTAARDKSDIITEPYMRGLRMRKELCWYTKEIEEPVLNGQG